MLKMTNLLTRGNMATHLINNPGAALKHPWPNVVISNINTITSNELIQRHTRDATVVNGFYCGGWAGGLKQVHVISSSRGEKKGSGGGKAEEGRRRRRGVPWLQGRREEGRPARGRGWNEWWAHLRLMLMLWHGKAGWMDPSQTRGLAEAPERWPPVGGAHTHSRERRWWRWQRVCSVSSGLFAFSLCLPRPSSHSPLFSNQ